MICLLHTTSSVFPIDADQKPLLSFCWLYASLSHYTRIHLYFSTYVYISVSQKNPLWSKRSDSVCSWVLWLCSPAPVLCCKNISVEKKWFYHTHGMEGAKLGGLLVNRLSKTSSQGSTEWLMLEDTSESICSSPCSSRDAQSRCPRPCLGSFGDLWGRDSTASPFL